jgi:hypothetical protein
MKDFEYAKKKNTNKRKRRWWVVSCGRYEVYLWGLPIYPLFLLSEKIKDWRYEHLVFTEERANKVLDQVLPKILSYDEEAKEYYYFYEWGVSAFWRKANIFNKRWAKKFSYKLRDHLVNNYEHPKYIKRVENSNYCPDSIEIVFKEKAE